MRRRLLLATTALGVLLAALLIAGPSEASACAGLIGSNGAVNLGRTTTLAAYHNGVEHYVTSFEFQGGGGEFGSLIPLPDVPTKVERGGGWTLQRLQLETQPRRASADARLASAAAPAAEAKVLLEARIDALDITVLEGGGPAVAKWAQAHGFRLSPDAPEVLDFYAERSPIFLAAVFDGRAAAARGQQLGDGTPVHLTIPTANPWVPLRILGLGKQPADLVQADVFLLTEAEPVLLPGPRAGFTLAHNRPATKLLLADLRGDAGMEWVPETAWLTKLQVNARARDLRFDLAVDARGGRPSAVAAGLVAPPRTVAQQPIAVVPEAPTTGAEQPIAVVPEAPATGAEPQQIPPGLELYVGSVGVPVAPRTDEPQARGEAADRAPGALGWSIIAASLLVAFASLAVWRKRTASSPTS